MIAGGNWWRANEIVIRHLTVKRRRAIVRVTEPRGACLILAEGGNPTKGLFVPNIVVNVEVVLPRIFPGIIAAHGVFHQLQEMLGKFVVAADGTAQSQLQSRSVIIPEHIAIALMQRTV